MGNRPNLGRFLGVRDLVIGTGLLHQGQNTAAWVRARGIADALDGALILGGAATGAFRRDRAAIGLAAAAGSSALTYGSPSDWTSRPTGLVGLGGENDRVRPNSSSSG